MIRATRKVNPPAPYDKLEAYELPDGTIVFSSVGGVDAMTGGRAKRGGLDRYARGMLLESGRAELAIVEFETPDGANICRGVTLSTFVEIVQWYADKYARGELRSNQLEIGQRCAIMQNVAARLGWETMARSWFGRTIPISEVPILQAEYTRREKLQWSAFYPWELPDALAKYFDVETPLSRGQWPKFMAGVHHDLYPILLGTDLAENARERRDELGAETIPQVLSDDLRNAIRSHLPTLLVIAEFSTSYAEWKQRVAMHVRRRRNDETPFGQRKQIGGETRQLTMSDLFGYPRDPEAA